MTINQYIKSLEKTIANRNGSYVELDWLKQRISDIKDAFETLGEKEVKRLCANRISGRTYRTSIEFFALCYGFAKDEDRPYTFWGDYSDNKHAVDIYESWKQHHSTQGGC